MYTHVRVKKKKVTKYLKLVNRSFRECRGLIAKHSDILNIIILLAVFRVRFICWYFSNVNLLFDEIRYCA